MCAAALRGEVSPWIGDAPAPETLAALERRLHYHGIAGLLNERREKLEAWPTALLDLMRCESLARTMWELRHKALIGELTAALGDAGIRTVIVKGTAYAYSLYERPASRFRGDTDLLVAEAALQDTRVMLAEFGWLRPDGAPGRFGAMHYQEIWRKQEPAGFTHDIDLHWEVTNSRALRAVLDGEQVLANSNPLPRLGPHARIPDTTTSLIHRAVNRAVHAQSGYYSVDRNEYDPDRLLWASDLDLLSRRMSASEWQELCARAQSSGIAVILSDALGFARRSLHTPVPDEVVCTLAGAPATTPTARYLAESTSSHEQVLANLKATPGIAARARFLLSHIFPSAEHMRRKFPDRVSSPLWILYARRVGGIFWGTLRSKAR
jgi:hypothetical protein